VAARQAFEFAHAHRARVADDAALGAPERHVDHSAFPRHPGGQRLHLVERHVGRVADAALRRAQHFVVDHADAFEHLQPSVVHLHGDGGDEDARGRAEEFVEIGVELQHLRGDVEPFHHRLERIFAQERRGLLVDGGFVDVAFKRHMRDTSGCVRQEKGAPSRKRFQRLSCLTVQAKQIKVMYAV
jgi:hypothetical protein